MLLSNEINALSASNVQSIVSRTNGIRFSFIPEKNVRTLNEKKKTERICLKLALKLLRFSDEQKYYF